MKKRQRRTLSAAFKFRVAFEAAKGLRSIQEIAAEQQVHPGQVTAWKKELLDNGFELFERKNARDPLAEQTEQRTGQLERKVGQLVLERDFLVKKCKELGIDP